MQEFKAPGSGRTYKIVFFGNRPRYVYIIGRVPVQWARPHTIVSPRPAKGYETGLGTGRESRYEASTARWRVATPHKQTILNDFWRAALCTPCGFELRDGVTSGVAHDRSSQHTYPNNLQTNKNDK